MQAPTKMKVPVKVISQSCAGVGGEFPRGYGNHMATISENGQVFAIVNLSNEDLEDAIKLGLVGYEIEADVYGEPSGTAKYVAFITDSRLPEKCLTPEKWYNSALLFAPEILRKKYNIPEDECICADEKLRNHTVSWRSFNHKENTKTGQCYQCKTEHKQAIKNY